MHFCLKDERAIGFILKILFTGYELSFVHVLEKHIA